MPPFGPESRLKTVTSCPSKGFCPGPNSAPNSSRVVLMTPPYSGSIVSSTVPSSSHFTYLVSCAKLGEAAARPISASAAIVRVYAMGDPPACDAADNRRLLFLSYFVLRPLIPTLRGSCGLARRVSSKVRCNKYQAQHESIPQCEICCAVARRWVSLMRGIAECRLRRTHGGSHAARR